MIVNLPDPPERWSPEYQRRLNAEIARVLEELNPARQVPEGGTTGQTLRKRSDRSLDLEWS